MEQKGGLLDTVGKWLGRHASPGLQPACVGLREQLAHLQSSALPVTSLPRALWPMTSDRLERTVLTDFDCIVRTGYRRICLGRAPMENEVHEGDWEARGLSNREPSLGLSTLEPDGTCPDQQHCLLDGVTADQRSVSGGDCLLGISEQKAQGSSALALRANCQTFIITECWQEPARNTAAITATGCEDHTNTNRHRQTDRQMQTQRFTKMYKLHTWAKHTDMLMCT